MTRKKKSPVKNFKRVVKTAPGNLGRKIATEESAQPQDPEESKSDAQPITETKSNKTVIIALVLVALAAVAAYLWYKKKQK